jgi:hypothetical protein
MRIHRIFAVVVCASLLAVIGCKGKTVTLITADGNTVQEAEDGQTLEWRILPSSVNVTSLEVQFIGTNPCGANQGPLVVYPNKPASCKVSAGSQTGGYVFYQYTLVVHESDPVGTHFPTRVIECTGCGLVAGGGGSTPDNGPQAAQSSPSTANPGSESSAPTSKNFSGNPFVVLDCVDQKVTVTPEDSDLSRVQWYSGGSIQPDWSVSFGSSSPCTETQPFNRGNNTCTISTPGTYNYTVTAAKCSATPGQGTVTIPAPPVSAAPAP